MGKRPTPADLDRWARKHVRYEARMLVEGAANLHLRYGPIPPPDGFKRPIVDDALLEATLVHVRLLDDFLTGRGASKSVVAKDWLRGWESDGITSPVNDRISDQVAHLAAKRAARPKWDLRAYAYTCCRELDRFLDEVERRCPPERGAAFEETRKHVRRGLRRLKQK